MSFLNVKIDVLDPVCEPKRATQGAVGLDLIAREAVFLAPNERALIPVGIRIELPPNSEAQVRPRSGLSMKGFEVSLGTIDPDYRGEVKVIMHNTTASGITFVAGQRIAQLVIYELPRVDITFTKDLSDSSRNAGGFGSTGMSTSDLNSGTDS